MMLAQMAAADMQPADRELTLWLLALLPAPLLARSLRSLCAVRGRGRAALLALGLQNNTCGGQRIKIRVIINDTIIKNET